MRRIEKTVVFSGGDTKTGTTMISLAAAEELAKEGCLVLYICAGEYPVNEFLPRDLMSASEEILAGLQEDMVSEQYLKQAAVTNRGVDILRGIRNGSRGLYFTQEDLEEICRRAETVWDWIVVDGGCVLSAEGRSVSHTSFGQSWMVITQQEQAVCRFRTWQSMVSETDERKIRYVVNKYNDSGAFYNLREMAELLHCEETELLPVPYVPYGWQAEAERETLLNFRLFRKAIRRLTARIQEEGADGRKV